MIALHDPALWPMRMTRAEVAAVCRCSARELRRRVQLGRFPAPEAGTWHRDLVKRYVDGAIKEYEKAYAKRAAQASRDGMRLVQARG